MCTGLEIAAIAGVALSAAGTAYGIASQPKPPTIPKPPVPPPPPGKAEPPPLAPTETIIGKGVAKQRRERERGFGLDQTILAAPQLGGTSGNSIIGGGLGRRGAGVP